MTIRLFRQHIRGPFFALAVTEGLILFVSVYVAAHLRFLGTSDPAAVIIVSVGPLPLRATLFASVMLLSVASMGLYRAQHFGGMSNILLRVLIGYTFGALALTPLFYFFPALYLGRGVLAVALLLSLAAMIAMRLLFSGLVDNSALKRRILVYGAGEKAAAISGLKKKTGFYIVGFIRALEESVSVPSHKIIHLEISLHQFVLEEEIDEIVVAVQDRRLGLPLDDLLNCRLSGVDVIDPAKFLERETGKLNLAMLSAGWIIFSDGFVQNFLRRATQRLFDLLASLTLLTLTLPLLAVVATAIRLESGRGQPILYRQTRVGRDQRTFQILKFRSMRVDAESTGVPVWATERDDRVTRVGAIMRKYRIDELPQILNVLRGDMSLVGPRPERPEFVNDLRLKIPFYPERHRVKPGLAGWAQMHYPYGADEEDAYQKLQYDLYYVKNCSLFLDFMILLQTAEVVLWGKGAR